MKFHGATLRLNFGVKKDYKSMVITGCMRETH